MSQKATPRARKEIPNTKIKAGFMERERFMLPPSSVVSREPT
jgi:hypothetical protein